MILDIYLLIFKIMGMQDVLVVFVSMARKEVVGPRQLYPKEISLMLIM